VQIDDEGEVGLVSLGALAEEARELLQELEAEAKRAMRQHQAPQPHQKKPRR
jgi:hypothetical protein